MPDSPVTLWVIASPQARYLPVLDQLPEGVQRLVADNPDTFLQSGTTPDVVLTCTGNGKVLQAIWPAASQAKWLHSLYAGLETTLFPELREWPGPLTNAQGVFARSLGEYAVTAMLYFAKSIARLRAQQQEGRWQPFNVEELHGRTLGIVGYGGIGRAAAERARPFGMRILATRRRPERSEGDKVVDEMLPFARLDEMLPQCDYVLVSAPLTNETRGLLNEQRLRLMKPTAVLINLARGPVVDEGALVRALEEQRLRGAALDVFDTEPLPAGHAFYRLENVLLSPHCADNTATWLEEAAEFFVESYRRWSRGEPLRNVVDKSAGY